jgi:hypothetical protein
MQSIKLSRHEFISLWKQTGVPPIGLVLDDNQTQIEGLTFYAMELAEITRTSPCKGLHEESANLKELHPCELVVVYCD